MYTRIYPLLESLVSGVEPDANAGTALARVVEAHPALAPLMDFYSPDPIAMAHEIGMVDPSEEDGDDDLAALDFGPSEWFEAAAGLVVVNAALAALRTDPGSIARAIYDPTLKAADVVADLEVIERVLLVAQQSEVRFHLRVEGEHSGWRPPRLGV